MCGDFGATDWYASSNNSAEVHIWRNEKNNNNNKKWRIYEGEMKEINVSKRWRSGLTFVAMASKPNSGRVMPCQG